jgi:hypothetical protein
MKKFKLCGEATQILDISHLKENQKSRGMSTKKGVIWRI